MWLLLLINMSIPDNYPCGVCYIFQVPSSFVTLSTLSVANGRTKLLVFLKKIKNKNKILRKFLNYFMT